MKNTRYFPDYQSAYNYYGGNVVPSTEIALVGDGSYVFVSSDNAVSGNQNYFDASMTNDEIVTTMTDAAYVQGTAYGEIIGYSHGYEGGYAYGFEVGNDEGYQDGYADGVAEGGGETSYCAFDNTTDATNFANGTTTGDMLSVTSGQFMVARQLWPMEWDAEMGSGQASLYGYADCQSLLSEIEAEYNSISNNGNPKFLQIFKQDQNTGVVEKVTLSNVSIDDTSWQYEATMSLSSDDKFKINTWGMLDDGMGSYTDDVNYITFSDPETGDENDWLNVETSGNYVLEFQFGTDTESGDTTAIFMITLVPGE